MNTWDMLNHLSLMLRHCPFVTLVVVFIASHILQAQVEGTLQDCSIATTRIIDLDGTSNEPRMAEFKDRFPWQVYAELVILNDKGETIQISRCGATIIRVQWIVSAAHCYVEDKFDNGKPAGSTTKVGLRVEFIAGLVDQIKRNEASVQKRQITHDKLDSQMFIHPEYNKVEKWANDIALFKIDPQFTQTIYVKPIALANLDDVQNKPMLTASGWGKMSRVDQTVTKDLRYVEGLKLIKEDGCLANLLNMPNNIICTKNLKKGTYIGDSGGPVVNGRKGTGGECFLIGVISQEYQAVSITPQHMYSIFTDITKYTSWMDPYIGTTDNACNTRAGSDNNGECQNNPGNTAISNYEDKKGSILVNVLISVNTNKE